MTAPEDGLWAPRGEVRASDAERDEVVGELGRRFVEGRLTHETFAARIDAALRARLRGELDRLTADLPQRTRLRTTALTVIADLRRRARAVSRPPFPSRLPFPPRQRRQTPAPLMLPAGPQDRFTIGRESACDLTVPDQTVSRWHARLVRTDGAWLLADLGSTNGTRLNGWRVSAPTPIAPGDLVTFGAATFVIRNRAGQFAPGGSPA